MTPAEELRRLIEADARNAAYLVERDPSGYYLVSRARLIAYCAKHYVKARHLTVTHGGDEHRDLELDAWDNLVRALEGWR